MTCRSQRLSTPPSVIAVYPRLISGKTPFVEAIFRLHFNSILFQNTYYAPRLLMSNLSIAILFGIDCSPKNSVDRFVAQSASRNENKTLAIRYTASSFLINTAGITRMTCAISFFFNAQGIAIKNCQYCNASRMIPFIHHCLY